MSTEEMTVGEILSARVPMVRTLGIEYLETTAERAVLTLPDRAEYHNHLA